MDLGDLYLHGIMDSYNKGGIWLIQEQQMQLLQEMIEIFKFCLRKTTGKRSTLKIYIESKPTTQRIITNLVVNIKSEEEK